MSGQWPVQKKQEALLALERKLTFKAVAELIEVPYATILSWYAKDPEFRIAAQIARESALDAIEDKLYERALQYGGTDAYFLLNGYRWERFANRTRQEHSGTVRIEIVNSPAETLPRPADLTIEAGDDSENASG